MPAHRLQLSELSVKTRVKFIDIDNKFYFIVNI